MLFREIRFLRSLSSIIQSGVFLRGIQGEISTKLVRFHRELAAFGSIPFQPLISSEEQTSHVTLWSHTRHHVPYLLSRSAGIFARLQISVSFASLPVFENSTRTHFAFPSYLIKTFMYQTLHAAHHCNCACQDQTGNHGPILVFIALSSRGRGSETREQRAYYLSARRELFEVRMQFSVPGSWLSDASPCTRSHLPRSTQATTFGSIKRQRNITPVIMYCCV